MRVCTSSGFFPICTHIPFLGPRENRLVYFSKTCLLYDLSINNSTRKYFHTNSTASGHSTSICYEVCLCLWLTNVFIFIFLLTSRPSSEPTHQSDCSWGPTGVGVAPTRCISTFPHTCPKKEEFFSIGDSFTSPRGGRKLSTSTPHAMLSGNKQIPAH